MNTFKLLVLLNIALLSSNTFCMKDNISIDINSINSGTKAKNYLKGVNISYNPLFLKTLPIYNTIDKVNGFRIRYTRYNNKIYPVHLCWPNYWTNARFEIRQHEGFNNIKEMIEKFSDDEKLAPQYTLFNKGKREYILEILLKDGSQKGYELICDFKYDLKDVKSIKFRFDNN